MSDAAPSPDAPYPRPAYAWVVVGLLFATAVLAYTDRQVMSLLVDQIRGELKIDDMRMSLLLGLAFALVYGVAGVPLGFLADRISRRNLILTGVAIWSLGTLGCGLAHGFGQLFGARIVVGLGEAVLSPAAISLISDYFAPKRRGLALGVYFTGITVGVGCSILIGSAILQLVRQGLLSSLPFGHMPPWRLVFLATGAVSLGWVLAIFLIREPARHTQDDSAADMRAAITRGIDWRALALIAPVYAAVAIASLVDNGVGAWAPSLLMRNFHADQVKTGAQLGVLVTIGYGGGMLLGGFLADQAKAWRGDRGKIELCLLAAALVAPASLLLHAPTQALTTAAVPLYFALSAVVTASGLSAILDATPNRARGLAMGVSFFLNVALGAGLGPTAVTTAGDLVFGGTSDLGGPLALTAVVFFGAAAIALAASLFARTRRAALIEDVRP